MQFYHYSRKITSYIYLLIFTISLRLHVKHCIALMHEKWKCEKICLCNYRSGISLSSHRAVTTKNTGKYDSIDLIFLYAGHSTKKCWSNSVALQWHASHTGLPCNFILLSVVFRAIVLVLASMKFYNFRKVRLLTLKYTNIFEQFKTALFINAIEFSFPYKRHKESFESI